VIGPILAALAALTAAVAIRRRRRSQFPARALIVSPRHSTIVAKDGTVRSQQSAELTMEPEALARIWNATNLENLARTYWKFLTTVTLGLIRVVYRENDRSVVLIARPLTLLRFDAPQYMIEATHGNVRWQIRDGLLVARSGRGCGYLSLDVRVLPPGPDGRATLRIEVEVANFYPAIAASFSLPVYMVTQSYIHELVTHAFLRSLAKLELAESKVGALADEDGDDGAVSPAGDPAQTPTPEEAEGQPQP
jgi:hypothetical protein